MKCKDKIIFNQFEMSKIVSISIDYNWLGSHSFSNLLYRVLLFNMYCFSISIFEYLLSQSCRICGISIGRCNFNFFFLSIIPFSFPFFSHVSQGSYGFNVFQWVFFFFFFLNQIVSFFFFFSFVNHIDKHLYTSVI